MRVFAIILLSFLFINASSQNNEDILYQDIILSSYDILSEYEKNCSFSNEDRYSEFKKLFVSESSYHSNDIPAMNDYNSLITVKDYINNIRNYYTRMNIDININSFSDIEFFSDQAELSVYITKTIGGSNAQESIIIKSNYYIVEKGNKFLSYAEKYVEDIEDAIFYETRDEAKQKINLLKKANSDSKSNFSITKKEENIEEFISYDDEFNLKVDLICNINSDSLINIKIKKIDLLDKKPPLLVFIPFVSNFFSKKKEYQFNMPIELNYDKKTNRNSSWTKKNIDGYFYSISNSNKVKIRPHDKLYYITHEIDPTRYNSSFKELKFNEYKYSIGLKYILPSNTINFLQNTNPTNYNVNPVDFELNNLDFNFSYRFNWNKFIVNIVANYYHIKFNHDIFINDFSYSYIDFDTDGAEYLRLIELNNIQENQLIDIESFYLNLEFAKELKLFKSNRTITLSGFLGGLPLLGSNFNVLSAKYNSSADALYSGYYSDLAGITISENGVYDFGQYEITGSGNIIEPSRYNSFQYGAGVSFKINSKLSFSLCYRSFIVNENVFNFGESKISKDFNELNSVMNINPIDMNNQNSFLTGLNFNF